MKSSKTNEKVVQECPNKYLFQKFWKNLQKNICNRNIIGFGKNVLHHELFFHDSIFECPLLIDLLKVIETTVYSFLTNS